MFNDSFAIDMAVTLSFLLGPFILYQIFKGKAPAFDKDRVSILNANYAIFNTLYAVFLGMALVTLLNTFYNAKDSIIREAETVFIASLAAEQLPNRAELRATLEAYAESMHASEFLAMEQGQLSPRTGELLARLWELAIATAPEGRAHENALRTFLGDLTDLNKYRLARAAKLSENLHPSVVAIIYLGYLLMLVKIWHTRIDWPRRQLANEIIVVGMLCAVIIIILDLKTPFSGIVNVTADPFDLALQRMRATAGR